MLEELFSMPCILKATGQTYFIQKVSRMVTPTGEATFLELMPEGNLYCEDSAIKVTKDSFTDFFVVR